jgi:hypothetical protein
VTPRRFRKGERVKIKRDCDPGSFFSDEDDHKERFGLITGVSKDGCMCWVQLDAMDEYEEYSAKHDPDFNLEEVFAPDDLIPINGVEEMISLFK